jgi:hypothetical protein
MRAYRAVSLGVMVLWLLLPICPHGHAQAALLLQDADGTAEVMSPLGHEAIYFARICAASLTQLRRCGPGEQGAVIARHRGIGGYDWEAMPLIPYLYSVRNASEVPAHVDRDSVQNLRLSYHDQHLMSLGKDVREGGGMHRGWNQLVGAAYERRIYAFRFETTAEQDDAFIAWMNATENRSHFSIFFRNCADFSAGVLNFYLPHTFGRRIVPDGGIVTPRQIAYQLVNYARKHPEIQLNVLEIPLIPGVHHSSRVGMSVAGSLVLTGYVIPIGFLNPYAGGAILADYLAWGRDPLGLGHSQVLTPANMAPLTTPTRAAALAALRSTP